MKRFMWICACMMFLLIISCQKDEAPNEKTGARIYLTDHQTPIFDSVLIDLVKLELKLDSVPNGGWVEFPIRSGVYNILRYRNGLHTLLSNCSLPNNRLKKVRLTLGSQNSVMKDGESTSLEIKDNEKQVEINLTPGHYDMATGQLIMWLDFDAHGSIKTKNSGQGSTPKYELKPQIKAFGKTKTGQVAGTVLPFDAQPILMVINGADTATAIPEINGEFKVMGLSPGNYKVLVGGQNNYRDTLINNVSVASGRSSEIGVITLRK